MAGPIPTLLGPTEGPTTPSYQSELQKMAAEWLKQQSPRGKGVRYTWANGLNDASSSILGAMMLKRAQDMELARLQATKPPVPTPTAPPLPLGTPPLPLGTPAPGGAGAALPLPPGVPGKGPMSYTGSDPGDPTTLGYPTFT